MKAPTLQSLPLYIRPPAEMESFANRKKKNAVKLLEVHNDEESDRNSNDGASNHDDWEGGDGFDEEKSVCSSISAANHPDKKPKEVTKATQPQLAA